MLYRKHPDEVLDFQIDWSDWLGTDTISTSEWAADSGITIDSESETTTTATVWLSGGTAGVRYEVENTITTTGGRTGVRSIWISVREADAEPPADYVTLTELKQFCGVATTDEDGLLQAILNSAARAIELYCGRWFEPRAATRYYRRDALSGADAWGRDMEFEVLNPRGKVLYLDDDLLSVTTLTNGDGTTISSGNYWLEPRNDGPPYWYIRLKSGQSWAFGTDGEISVAGSWGYSTTAPEDIRQACLEYAAYLYRLKDSQVFDVAIIPDAGMMTLPKGLPQSVKVKLDPYRRLA